jgi:succinyl-CoA synthetase beta subunit
MKLLEYKGKQLLKSTGIRVPPAIITDNKSYINLRYHKNKFQEFFYEHKAVVIKAQVPYGYRKKHGLIKSSSSYSESLKIIDEMYNKEFMNQPIHTLLIEKKLDIAEEYYIAIVYDTESRQPMIIFSGEGGIDIEDVLKSKDPNILKVSLLDGLHGYEARELAKDAGIKGRDIFAMAKFIEQCYESFISYDCKALEINPIIKTTPGGLLFAGDAKITIDDNSVSRNDIFADVTSFEDRRLLTKLEVEARKIDIYDHRGVAGKSFMELDGDIAVMASGGGASLTCMDALIRAGGKPANYTEYSGNPPREKVKKLTKVTLSKKGLNGCLVIGGTANFTDVYETLAGFGDGLKEIKPKYPIVVRRAGHNIEKAFSLLNNLKEEFGLNISLYGEETPMTEAVKIIVSKVNKYKTQKGD